MEISFGTSALIVIISTISGWLANIATSYFSEKGKNAATKEDIGEITKIVEEVKNKLVLDLELQKISYSGIYKEKIGICRELLTRTYQLKRGVQDSAVLYSENLPQEFKEKLMTLIDYTQKNWNDYFDFYMTSRPFLSDEIFEATKKFSDELYLCFKNFKNPFIHKDIAVQEFKSKLIDRWLDSEDKLFHTDFFPQLELLIVNEIKKDLKLIAGS
ncbi:MAG TPA: hypothetical protein VHB48_06275 [Chitinophagaceae bacterium]|nr:hypothetical protein [Chitinophagaceae bacterium]